MKKIFGVFIILLILVVVILIINRSNIHESIISVKKKNLGEPIEKTTGLINNEFFSIETGENGDAIKNTKGINNALKYACEHNIEYIKLKQGIYIIDGIGNKGEKKGIQIESNITFDINNSILKHKDNDQKRYSIINIDDEENITICNGIIIGDKDEHIYEDGTNEWGFGIEILDSKNITVNNVEIYNLIGDGILITGDSFQVNINNNNIYDCRRQGISVCGGEKIQISNNEIYQIVGTAPQSGIDIEASEGKNKVKDIIIKSNKIYSTKSNLSIISSINVENAKIIGNELQGDLLICDVANQIEIQDNIIKNGDIHAYITKPIYNTDRSIDDVYILNNIIENGSIILNSKDKKIVYGKVLINNNTINEGIIELYSVNAEINNNSITNLDKREYCFKIEKVKEDMEQYVIKMRENDISGTYNNQIIKEEGIQILNEQ